MEKKMQQVEVSTNGEQVIISQDTFGGDAAQIWISPDQVDVLVKWLMEAKNEFLGGVDGEFADFGGRENGSQN